MQVFKRRRAPSLIPYLLESPGISFNVIHHDASAFPPCVKRSFWKHLAAPGYARTIGIYWLCNFGRALRLFSGYRVVIAKYIAAICRAQFAERLDIRHR